MRSPRAQPNAAVFVLLLLNVRITRAGATARPGMRYYSPEMGRWVNRDPLAEKRTVLNGNCYRMVKGNPMSLFDGLGLFPSYTSCSPLPVTRRFVTSECQEKNREIHVASDLDRAHFLSSMFGLNFIDCILALAVHSLPAQGPFIMRYRECREGKERLHVCMHASSGGVTWYLDWQDTGIRYGYKRVAILKVVDLGKVKNCCR